MPESEYFANSEIFRDKIAKKRFPISEIHS